MDPVTIPGEQFNSDCLPPIEATDLLSYLVLETSFYTKQQFKAYKSLEAYNFMVSGFITSIQGCIVSGKHVVVGKVRHSLVYQIVTFNYIFKRKQAYYINMQQLSMQQLSTKSIHGFVLQQGRKLARQWQMITPTDLLHKFYFK